MSKIKQRSTEANGAIKPRYVDDINPEKLHPYFSLRYLGGNYCLSACTTDEKAAFADRLHILSKMTWLEIKSAPRHGLGTEIIGRDSLKTAVPGHITDETNLIAFRCIGKAPMIGYRQRATFYVLWIDRDFTLYPH